MVESGSAVRSIIGSCFRIENGTAVVDREWDCGCGAHHKRHFLAACNIRYEGLLMLAAGQTDSLKARVVDTRAVVCGRSTSNREFDVL
jgi:hypothetical protein